jgi:hypothetical protein|tara:strand:- start:120 stop:299 length:180 start_codon:yes stop_codon:yes gene_type:complete
MKGGFYRPSLIGRRLIEIHNNRGNKPGPGFFGRVSRSFHNSRNPFNTKKTNNNNEENIQ